MMLPSKRLPVLLAYAFLNLVPPVLGATPQAAAVTTRSLTPQQAVKFRKLSSLRFSPDGSHLVFAVSDLKASGNESHLWMLDVKRGTLRQFTFSDKVERAPEWAPDGRSLAFLSNRRGATEIYVLPLDGGEAFPVTVSGGAGEFHWSPDGRKIAYLSQRRTSAPQNKPTGDARVADQAQNLDGLWLVDPATRKAQALTDGPWRIDEFAWAGPDRLLAVASPEPASERWNTALYSIALTNGTFTLAGNPPQPFSDLGLSPKRTRWSWIATRTAGPVPHDLFIQPAAGGAPSDISASLDRAVTEVHWQDEDTPWFSAVEGFQTRIYRGSLHAAPTPVDLPCSVRGFDVAPDGTLAFVGVGFDRLPELFLKSPGQPPRQVSRLQEDWSGIHLVAPEMFSFKSFDGTPVEAALLRPPASVPGQKPPLVLLVHGGPAGAFSAEYYWFASWAQLLAARGCQVLLVNPRGSKGYGEAFLKANRADWGGGDFKDLMAGVDAVLARGEADPHRLGIGGWSYGGEMTQWAITQTQRFRAAVTGAGVFDQAAEFSMESDPVTDEWYFGTPWEQLETFRLNSPSTFIRQAKTPTLILHGENDPTNPVGQSKALYRALKRYGVETQLVTYPGEGHLPRLESHQIDILERMLAWFEEHLR